MRVDGATWVPTRGRPRRIDFVAASLPEMLRVKRCWVATELDVATVRDDHCAAVVEFETMLCFPRTYSRHRKAKHCTQRMRNPVCREAFQQDLERIQVRTAGIHVDNIWETFWVSKARIKKTLAHLSDLDPFGLSATGGACEGAQGTMPA